MGSVIVVYSDKFLLGGFERKLQLLVLNMLVNEDYLERLCSNWAVPFTLWLDMHIAF